MGLGCVQPRRPRALHARPRPLDGSLHILSNRRRDRLKVLFREPGGLRLCNRRLEQGALIWPKPNAASVRGSRGELTPLPGGIDLAQGHRRKSCRREPAPS